MANDDQPRDEQGRFASSGGGGGGSAGKAKDWAKGAPKAGGGGGAPSAKEWAGGKSSLAGAASRASAAADSHKGDGTHEKGAAHQEAAAAHEKAHEAAKAAGNEKAAAAHAAEATRHREEASAHHHEAAMKQAESVTASSAKSPLREKREWAGKQTNPDKMEFSGQFAGHGKQTIDDHFVNGKPSAARAAFHEKEIIKPAFEGKKTAAELHAAGLSPSPKPTAILTMGGPASGKGVVLGNLHKNGLDTSHFVHVDPDEVKGKLPEYKAQVPRDKGKTFVGAAAQVHEESSYVAKKIRDKAIEGGHNVVIDGTGGNAKKFVELIDHLKGKGYDVHVHHPHLDVEEGVKRALKRAEGSGRHVPEKFIRETYDSIGKAQDHIIAAAPHYTRYDAGAQGHPVSMRK